MFTTKCLVSISLESDVNSLFGFEEGFFKELAEVPLVAAAAEGSQFFLEVAALQAQESVGQGIVLLVVDVFCG